MLTSLELKALAVYAWYGDFVETARALHRSRSSVLRHIASARDKLGATTTTNAVYLAWPQIRSLYDRLEAGDRSLLE